LSCSEQGIAPDLTALSVRLPEQTVNRIAQLLARNYDVGIGARDVEMYLQRIEQSKPPSVEAAEMNNQQLEDYFEQLRQKKMK
jgi:DNA primase